MDDKTRIRLLLVRHTQTFQNAERRYSGAKEVTMLTPKGHLQAYVLANALRAFPVRAIYASDLLRTRQVASYISAVHPAAAVIHDARLREVDVGLMGGLTKVEAKERFPEPRFRTSAPDYDFTSIGGESRVRVIERHLGCFREVLERYGDADENRRHVVVVVGHGTSFRTMLQHLGIRPPELHAQGDYQEILFDGA